MIKEKFTIDDKKGSTDKEKWSTDKKKGMTDKKKNYHSTNLDKEKAILIGLSLLGSEDSEESIAELERLADTAKVEVVGKIVQRRKSPHPHTLIGPGKAQQLHDLCQQLSANLIIADEDLTPAQQKNLEEISGIRVIDRTQLILDIFAQRAKTSEGKLQVELAQIKYYLPRLTRKWTHLSRQTAGAGVGLRGPGETQLEVDRRKMRKRLETLEKKVDKVRKNREIQRGLRRQKDIFQISLVGYTNAGKSTLLNALSGADIPADDKLFMTLDPTVKRVYLGDDIWVLMVDTVGFIRKLPHGLVKAFKATLEEVKTADLLIHVKDATMSDNPIIDQEVFGVLKEIEADDKPIITVYNKIDRAKDEELGLGKIKISAKTGEGMDKLKKIIRDHLKDSGEKIAH